MAQMPWASVNCMPAGTGWPAAQGCGPLDAEEPQAAITTAKAAATPVAGRRLMRPGSAAEQVAGQGHALVLGQHGARLQVGVRGDHGHLAAAQEGGALLVAEAEAQVVHAAGA